jgi:predicted ATPase/DNA-binding winged helix-turn-helix (wHTH) protein
MTLKFGRFQVLPHRREFLADGVPVALGSRAFDVLMSLIEAGGELVSKDEILRRVWPGMVVEEHSLQFHISTLRKILGNDRGFIKTISGRGYRFVADITPAGRQQEAFPGQSGGSPPTLPGAGSRTNVPAPTSELIGREIELSEASALLTTHRLVTLVGAGGIGKTRLGIEVARRLRSEFADGVWVAELGPLSDPDLVPVTVATALGLDIARGQVTLDRVANELSAKQFLLVLDNCEHVIDAAASVAETLLRANPTAHVMATSREPLRAADERVYRVPPLTVPAAHVEDLEDLLRCGAAQLFIARVAATEPHFAANERIAPAIAAICRRLDGIALAIELSAACAAALGVEEVAAHLDDRFELLAGGRRTALPRHQTLRATLDWSYELLSEDERVVLRRLSIFAGSFTLEVAGAIAASAELAVFDVINAVANLVAKSLVVANAGGTIARYRLLETTRAYALEKLTESGELEQIARRHGEYCRDLLDRAETELETKATDEWLAEFSPWIDNIRAALDWAFSPSGDTSIGVALTAASVPLWMYPSLLDECRVHVERALTALAAGANRDADHEMKLHAALGASLIYTRDATSPEIGAAWTKALEIAERLDDAEYQLRSLWGLWFFDSASSRHRSALALAQRFCILAANRPDPSDRLIGERLIGVSQHYLGNQSSARGHLERVLDHASPVRRSHIIRFQIDQQGAARVFLARTLWLQGFPDQAMATAESTIEDARASNHPISLYQALALGAYPIALLVGDLAAAEHYGEMLLNHSTRHALANWRAIGRSYQGVLVIQRGDVMTGLQMLRAGFDEFGKPRFIILRLIASLMAEALGRAGQIADGLSAVEEALASIEQTDERWVIADLLRVKGELLLLQGAPGGAARAEDHFRKALEWARRHGALSWELRAAVSLARLWRDQNRTKAAREILAPVYDQFTEGFETADLKAAKLLLDDLRPARRQPLAAATLGISLCTGLASLAEILAAF